ncbi:hypothetical protein Cgig2_009826 [Carnegiea gigantea]|uniref:Uncharacterized protein n=1 Tax=Carnegiea gigantea TaxID=171969 RepID=A0A9Q1GUX2_9CARY|nr:hypothetical protein Cgig2_020695 [Carnegiea gigantea]KAJ8425033.1 hypothetical protein Cgig2_009826 [Carnegiea gigantea]
MKLQGFMEKEPILRLMVFSASIFFILLVLPLHQDSLLKSTYNSHSMLITGVDKVTKTDTEIHIHNSSASTIAPSLTPNKPAANASEKKNNSEMLNSFETSGKAVENVIEIKVLNSSKVTIVSPDTHKEARLHGSKGENNSQYRSDHNLLFKMGKSSIHDLSATTYIPPSMTNKSRYYASEGEKSFRNKGGAVVKQEDQMKVQLSRLVRGKEGLAELEFTGISCSSGVHLDLCVINQPIILEKKSKSFTIYAPSSQHPPTKRVVRPYPKKEDQNTMMNWVAPVNIIQGKANQIKAPPCQVKHNVPALVFSFGGFTDNNFHKFSEVIIPLFITSRHFGSRVQFVVTDNLLGENWKFKKVLKHLSPHDVIDANEEGDKRVHCFPAAVVGLRYFGNLEVNSSDTPGGYAMADFKEFLRESYNLKVANTLKPRNPRSSSFLVKNQDRYSMKMR